MTSLLRSWSRAVSGIAVALLAFGAAPKAQAQCTITAAGCTPGTASNSQAAAFGLYIANVTVGNNLINRSSSTYNAGYHNYTCTNSATLTVGQSYPISIRTNPTGLLSNVRVWIDYSNDGTFSTNELVFSSDNNTLHTGTFSPPANATLSTRLRMRVAIDAYVAVPLPGPCTTPQYGQDEDYGITLVANTAPPAAAFTTNVTTTCTGCVQFTDASANVPTSWLWNFGDNTTSTQQNPNHCYATAGTYAVTLQATNAAGTTTSAATTIVYNSSVPVAASCTPQTINYFGNYGITRFRLGTIDNTSANGSAGYQDFTCPQRTELVVGVSYSMTINTGGTNAHDIRVYLDRNNDGVLATSEQIYQSLATASPGATTTITLPGSTVLNQPLRLRVVADAVGNNPGPCTNPVSGQAEDYTVIARPNTLPPLIDFTTNYVAGGCVNPIQFTDLTTNAPTSWLWNFGDGTAPSTLQNPTHQYATSGSYNVSLTATNANGTATITRLNAVTVTVPCLTYCASNGTGGLGPGGGQQPSGFYITNVAVSNAQPAFTKSTLGAPAAGGYGNYTAQPITMNAGSALNLTVTTNANITHRTVVWVDSNLSGTFDANEVRADMVVNNTAVYTTTFTVPVTTPSTGLNTRMRIQVQAINSTATPQPCAVNLLNAEVEDYQLRVLPLAAHEAQLLPALSIFPNPTADGRVRLSLPDARAAGLYTTEVQNLLGATVLTTALRLGPAADADLNLSALAPGVYVLRLRDASGQTALRRVVRQ